MLFGSIEFAVFLPIVFALYWAVPKHREGLRNWILLVSSYVFYGWWDVRFLSLIIGSSFLDFWVGLRLSYTDDPARRKLLLTLSVAVNLGLLATFKYFNFFIDSFNGAFSLLGIPITGPSLNIVLPVGISFYTFQTMSYSIDAYRRKLEPSRDLVPFLAFVAFFPQLVAGPIERASHLLPQFYRASSFDQSKGVDGLRQMLWGFFKKMVVADNCAPFVNDIFSNYGSYSGSTLFLGALLFAFQIYGDFSGYSDIAVGTAKLFDFDLMQNFAYPYFSRDIAEFWRRWHISLSTWFRDYLYIPLGGSRTTRLLSVRNVFVVFLVSGLWHGTNWTFVMWGLLHALYFLPLLLSSRNRTYLGAVAEGRWFPRFGELLHIAATFFLVVIAWVFFRAESVAEAFAYLSKMLDPRQIGSPQVHPPRVIGYVAVMLVVEWLNRHQPHALAKLPMPRPMRWACYFSLGYAVLLLSTGAQNFIYFQF